MPLQLQRSAVATLPEFLTEERLCFERRKSFSLFPKQKTKGNETMKLSEFDHYLRLSCVTGIISAIFTSGITPYDYEMYLVVLGLFGILLFWLILTQWVLPTVVQLLGIPWISKLNLNPVSKTGEE